MRRSFLIAAGLAILLALLIETVVGQPGVIAAATDNKTELTTLLLNPVESGVEILNPELKGNAAQHGVYAQVGDFFKGLPSTGIVLSSGKVEEVKFGGFPDTVFGGPGDTDLDTALKAIDPAYLSLDASVLSFQVKVSRPVTIKVAYVFGSIDFVWGVLFPPPNGFPDIFGLFLNNKNVALIGGMAVSTANIRCFGGGLNCDQLIHNYDRNMNSAVAGTSLFYYTKTQLVTLDLPVGTHQLKVAVADGSTGFLDAAVFLSFVGAVKAPTAAPVSPPLAVPVSPPMAVPVGTMKMAMMKMMN
jgi:hypothetical protein